MRFRLLTATALSAALLVSACAASTMSQAQAQTLYLNNVCKTNADVLLVQSAATTMPFDAKGVNDQAKKWQSDVKAAIAALQNPVKPWPANVADDIKTFTQVDLAADLAYASALTMVTTLDEAAGAAAAYTAALAKAGSTSETIRTKLGLPSGANPSENGCSAAIQ